MRRRAALHRFGALALLLGPGQLAFGASIVAVRLWPAADYSRVTIESDQALAARHLIVDNPPRVVVDIDGLELDPALRALVGQVKPDDPYIAGLRAGQYQPRVVRLVVDLKQPVKPQTFALEPVAAYRHRLVLDLYPVELRDPLLELIRDRERTAPLAAASSPDKLGDFIGRVDKPAASIQAAQAAASSVPPPGAPRPPVAAAPAEATPTAVASAGQQSAGKAPPRLTAEAQQRIDRLVVVTIDPGHGGEDPGAIGPSGLKEKDVVLAIALKLRQRLDGVAGMRAMLTRDADFFVPLHERVRKARRVQADLFVSVHADAFMTPQARGASVFALSSTGATSAAARWMAKRENSADLVGGANTALGDDAQLMHALLDMSTAAQIKDSLGVGRDVLEGMGRIGALHKPRVEQAGFAVLKAPDIPSILVETAFISNPSEERLLRDLDYQDQLVEAMFTGIRRYFARNPPLARPRVL